MLANWHSVTMNCLISPLVAYPSGRPDEASFPRRSTHSAADLPLESFVPTNGNFLDHVSKDQALRKFAVQFRGPRDSKCCDDSPRRDGRVEDLDRLARASDIRPMNGKEEKIFRDALALINRAGKRSKRESGYYAEMKPGGDIARSRMGAQ